MTDADLSQLVEDLANLTASEAWRPRPRKRETVGIIAAWDDVRPRLPGDAKRVCDVEACAVMVREYGIDQARPMFEAIAKLAIWYEGYAFAQT